LGKLYWIDVTELLGWHGNLTGIQRTSYHLGEEFARRDDVRFFSWTKQGNFVQAEFPLSQTFHDKKVSPIFWGGDDARRIRHYALRVLNAVQRRVLPSRVRSLLARAHAGLGQLLDDLLFWAGWSKAATGNAISHPFAKDDVILAIGATWAYEGLMDALYLVRESAQIKIIVTVYDLIPVYFPQFFGQGFGSHFYKYVFDVVSNSDLILSISKSTTRDLVKFQKDMNLPATPVLDFRLGDDPAETPGLQSPDDGLVAGEFILAVGTVEIRKNYDALYKAWTMAADQGKEIPPLVIVGRPGWSVGDLLFQIDHDPRVAGKIIILSHVKDDGLSWLYANCLMTVYPSWYEGWGLPIAESVHYGKLCIASKTSSMKEIAGDLLVYCDPNSPQEFLDAVERFVKNTAERERFEKRIIEEYRVVRWNESYNQLIRGLEGAGF
jgi:glycosyltransferase involved in cell wall biosynthesis